MQRRLPGSLYLPLLIIAAPCFNQVWLFVAPCLNQVWLFQTPLFLLPDWDCCLGIVRHLLMLNGFYRLMQFVEKYQSWFRQFDLGPFDLIPLPTGLFWISYKSNKSQFDIEQSKAMWNCSEIFLHRDGGKSIWRLRDIWSRGMTVRQFEIFHLEAIPIKLPPIGKVTCFRSGSISIKEWKRWRETNR